MSQEKSKNLQVVTPEMSEEETDYQRLSSMTAGDWLITQEILQDIEALEWLKAEGKEDLMPSAPKLLERLKIAINERYKEDEETKALILKFLPTKRTITNWHKKQGWDDAVKSRLRNQKLYTPGMMAAVIKAVYEKAIVKGDIRAAELYLKLAGELGTDAGKNSKEWDDYKRYNRVLHEGKRNK